MRTLIAGGQYIDAATPAEVAALIEQRERETLRGIKPMRIPQITGTAAASKISFGQASQVGPDSGYAWSVRRIIVGGMTTGATPDALNMYVNDVNSQPLWQFNGNSFGYTFGPLEIVVNPGEVLMFASVGTFAATGVITVSGQVVEVPAEMIGKLAVH